MSTASAPPSGHLPGAARGTDLAAIGVAALFALAMAGEVEGAGRVTGDALFGSLILALAACAALWWRRSRPVTVALALAPVSAVTELAGAAVLIAVYTVAAQRRWPIAVAVGVAHAALAVPYSVLVPDQSLGVLGATLVSGFLLSVAVASGVIVRARRELAASLREQADRAATEARLRQERSRALERESIAREMHDVLAHRISLISLHAGALEVRPDLSSEAVAEIAATIRRNSHLALEDLREVLGVLRSGDGGSAPLRPPPDLTDLAQLIAESRASGAAIEVHDRLPDGLRPQESTGRVAYRIVQEGLTNAAKHAPGAGVRLDLVRPDDGDLYLRLGNRLTASAAQLPGGHCGLVGLAERVELAGGRFTHGVRHDADGGLEFAVEAWLPWSPP